MEAFTEDLSSSSLVFFAKVSYVRIFKAEFCHWGEVARWIPNFGISYREFPCHLTFLLEPFPWNFVYHWSPKLTRCLQIIIKNFVRGGLVWALVRGPERVICPRAKYACPNRAGGVSLGPALALKLFEYKFKCQFFFQISVYVYICDKNTCSKSTPEYNSTKKLSFTQQQRKPCASFFHETHGHTFPYPKRKENKF